MLADSLIIGINARLDNPRAAGAGMTVPLQDTLDVHDVALHFKKGPVDQFPFSLLGRFWTVYREVPAVLVKLPYIFSYLRRVDPRSCDEETFCAFLMLRLGESEPAIRSFWDVFIRPALNLPSDEASAALGVMTVQTALLSGRRRASDLLLPTAPLGDMHGVAAGHKLESLGARVKTNTRVVQLIPGAAVLADGDRVVGDAFVVAVPPLESARLLDEPDPELGKSPIVSVHLWFDRELLPFPLAALLNSDAHWIFDRGRLTGHRPERGQYLTVVSSGVPELMDVRGRELVELMRDELTGRLGDARLLWSRVSREPAATFEGRPGTAARRRGPRTSRFNVVRAGAWTDTGWPATMESAVRSGRTAARMLSDVATKLAA